MNKERALFYHRFAVVHYTLQEMRHYYLGRGGILDLSFRTTGPLNL